MQIMELEICAHRQEAMMVYGESDTSNNYIIPYNVTINCICPQTHYWKLQKYTYEEHGLIQIFKCVKVHLVIINMIESIFAFYKIIIYRNNLYYTLLFLHDLRISCYIIYTISYIKLLILFT